MSPSAYRNGAAGMAIRYGVAACSLGWVVVAASERGVCAIEFGDDPAELPTRLKSRFPGARLAEGEPDFVRVVEQVVDFVDAPADGLPLPLDIRGTEHVWDALRQVPPGTTVGYAELAARIGRPEAARAVAGACAANGLAVAIPCHRVVRADGQLSGYRWGVERKRALLERERSVLCWFATVEADGQPNVTPKELGDRGHAGACRAPDVRRRARGRRFGHLFRTARTIGHSQEVPPCRPTS